MKILALLADGFEETEFVVPFDLWQRGGCEIVTASIKGSTDVTGAHGLPVQASTTLGQANLADFDGIFLPGGGLGVKNLAASADVEKAVCTMNDADKWIFAICAAPLVLSKAGLLIDRRCTCLRIFGRQGGRRREHHHEPWRRNRRGIRSCDSRQHDRHRNGRPHPQAGRRKVELISTFGP